MIKIVVKRGWFWSVAAIGIGTIVLIFGYALDSGNTLIVGSVLWIGGYLSLFWTVPPALMRQRSERGGSIESKPQVPKVR